jgi:hypothetical protein
MSMSMTIVSTRAGRALSVSCGELVDVHACET